MLSCSRVMPSWFCSTSSTTMAPPMRGSHRLIPEKISLEMLAPIDPGASVDPDIGPNR